MSEVERPWLANYPKGVPATPRDDVKVIAPRMTPGVHTVTLANFVQAPASKSGAYYVAYIATYRAEGLSYQRIANRLCRDQDIDVTHTTVKNWIDAFDIDEQVGR